VTNEEIKFNLSSAYKILSYLNMDDHTYTHLSARSAEGDSFYIYPFGMRFEEVFPDALMKVSFEGDILEGKEYQYNRTGYMIHGVVYKHRVDVQAAFHFHTPEIVAVSSIQGGLLPINQWALHFYGGVSYHDYDSLTLEQYHAERLVKDLAGNFVLMMRNHGALTLGKTIPEAMFYSYHLQKACEGQCLTLAMNHPIVLPSAEICQKSVNDLLSFEKNLGERDWGAWLRMIEIRSKQQPKSL
jgi:ribulose-5-phosphate 4-epimerase/fuculose-1-phosphate aldolase